VLTVKLGPFDNSTVLIVGGAGFVGSNLSRFLLDNTSLKKLVIVDNFLSSQPENIPLDSRADVIVGSIASERVLAQLPDELDYVFHLACFHGNQSSIHDPVADHDNNSLTSLMLFEHLQHKPGVKKVVYAAAGCAVALKTYDEPAATYEDAPVSLFHDSPYSISKLVGEMYGNYYFQRTGFPFVKARFQNVYGPGEVLGAGQWRGTHHTVWRNVVPTFIWKALHGEPLSLDNQGNSTRDFIYVGDLVEGLLRCALLGVPGEAYNLGTGVETTIRKVAELVLVESASDSELLLGPSRAWDTSGRRFAATNKSEEALRFVASTDIGSGIRETVSWTRENLHAVSAAIAKHQIHMIRDGSGGVL
jgi:nucleoside-diphosphate-sugar epimerase